MGFHTAKYCLSGLRQFQTDAVPSGVDPPRNGWIDIAIHFN